MEGGTQAAKDKDQLLVLKVMRLTRPSFYPTIPVITDSRDLAGDTFLQLMKQDIGSDPSGIPMAIGPLLVLPQNFGNIFLGETFSSYISVHNDSGSSVTSVTIKVELQTSSQRLTLVGINGNSSQEALDPSKSIDDVINHEVKELGTHILVCAVSYVGPTGENLYFRKFFKFQVLKPLDVKTKFYNADSDDVFLEAQIQNTTFQPIHMEKVTLEASNLYEAVELNGSDENQFRDKDDQLRGRRYSRRTNMNHLDCRQYLYCLTPKKDVLRDDSLRGVTNIGKLDIVWKTNMGEKGRLQTSQLQRMAQGYGDIRVTVNSIPNIVCMGVTFTLSLNVANCSDRTMDLMMALQNERKSRGLSGTTPAMDSSDINVVIPNATSPALVWTGVSNRHIGKLAPKSSLGLELSLIPRVPGLHSISGLRIVDTFLKRTYEHDEIAQVLVICSDPDDPSSPTSVEDIDIDIVLS